MSAAVASLDERLENAATVGLALRDLRRSKWRPVLDIGVGGVDGLEVGEFDTLDQVAWVDHVRMLDLAEALQIDASTATRAVDRLVRRGLVDRGRDPDDGRYMRVWITAGGRLVHSASLQRRLDMLASVLDQFDGDERDALARLLPKLAERITAGLQALEAQPTLIEGARQ